MFLQESKTNTNYKILPGDVLFWIQHDDCFLYILDYFLWIMVTFYWSIIYIFEYKALNFSIYIWLYHINSLFYLGYLFVFRFDTRPCTVTVGLELLTLILELQPTSVLPHPGNFSYHVQIIYDRVIFLLTKDTQALILIWIPYSIINKRKWDVQ